MEETEKVEETINEEGQSEYFMKFPTEERVRVLKLPYKLPKKLRDVIDGLKWAIHFKKQSAVIVVDGRSGMGKTTLSFQIAKYVTPDFSLGKVYFTPDEFMGGLSVAKKGDTLVFDEAMLISSRAALSQVNRMIIQAMSMIRSKNLMIIFNVNSIFDLDRNLALSRADLLLHCYGESLTDKGKFLAFFKGADGWDRIKQLYLLGKKFYSYAQPKSNFNTTFSANFVLDEDEYEKIKQENVNKFLSKKVEVSKSKTIKSRDAVIRYLHDQKEFTQTEIAEIAELSQQEVSIILKKTSNQGSYSV